VDFHPAPFFNYLLKKHFFDATFWDNIWSVLFIVVKKYKLKIFWQQPIKNIKELQTVSNSVFHRILDYNRGGFQSGPFFYVPPSIVKDNIN
jgi:hypothetical protein